MTAKITIRPILLLLASLTLPVSAQVPDSEAAHLAAAKQAAGFEFAGTLSRNCIDPARDQVPSGPRGVIPDRASWHAEPVKMFDNLYFIGTQIHSAWALKGNAGIIVIDTVYNYAAEDEMVNGLKKLGLDPASVKYVIVSHAHGDHDEGARLFQDRYGAHVVLGKPDWDALDKSADIPGGKPKRDIEGHDGQVIRLGDVAVTLIETPGHTPGTLSFLFQTSDRGKPVTVAYSGGTAIFGIYKSAEGLDTFIATQNHIAQMAKAAGASVLMTNHSAFDGAWLKSRLMAVRGHDEPHPYALGADGVQRYFTLMQECALAAKSRLKQ
jgi:metallo-beta-lactamase class B